MQSNVHPEYIRILSPLLHFLHQQRGNHAQEASSKEDIMVDCPALSDWQKYCWHIRSKDRSRT